MTDGVPLSGGVSHGPRGPTSYYYMLPMKVRAQGLKVALSSKVAQVSRADQTGQDTLNSAAAHSVLVSSPTSTWWTPWTSPARTLSTCWTCSGSDTGGSRSSSSTCERLYVQSGGERRLHLRQAFSACPLPSGPRSFLETSSRQQPS